MASLLFPAARCEADRRSRYSRRETVPSTEPRRSSPVRCNSAPPQVPAPHAVHAGHLWKPIRIGIPVNVDRIARRQTPARFRKIWRRAAVVFSSVHGKTRNADRRHGARGGSGPGDARIDIEKMRVVFRGPGRPGDCPGGGKARTASRPAPSARRARRGPRPAPAARDSTRPTLRQHPMGGPQNERGADRGCLASGTSREFVRRSSCSNIIIDIRCVCHLYCRSFPP